MFNFDNGVIHYATHRQRQRQQRHVVKRNHNIRTPVSDSGKAIAVIIGSSLAKRLVRIVITASTDASDQVIYSV